MLLLVDVGNTNVTLALVRGGAIATVRRATTPRAPTADELELLIAGLVGLDGARLEDVATVAWSSVVPAVTSAMHTVALRREISLVAATPGTVPIAIRVDRPGEVGGDRLVNALAAHRLYGGPAVIADCGTATTVDAIGADGGFLGGAIAPGLRLGMEALASRTALLPSIELRQPARAIGTTTVSALQSGVVLGYRALLSGLIARVRAELGEATGTDATNVRTILTGGLSGGAWANGLADVVDPDLTLKGLMILHAEVTGGESLRAAIG